VRLLIAFGARVNQVDPRTGFFPLLYAAQNGHAEVVRLLLAGGAEVGQAHSSLGTSLVLAQSQGHADVARLLFSTQEIPLFGSCVRLHGAETGVNGAEGFVDGVDAASGHCTVKLDGGGEAKVKAINLRRILDGGATDHLFGDRVQLQGLRAKPEMNGTMGVVQKLDLATGRYVIKLDGGVDEAKVRAENLVPMYEKES
jgi:hypothetical protein